MAVPPAHALRDYIWLVSAEGAVALADAAAHPGSLLQKTNSLRRRLSPERTHLVLEQVALRERARTKFSAAGRMFFTATRLEQATSEPLARYKAARFPAGEPLADLCCGLGGDLLALAERGPTRGVDLDPVAALLAEANCLALSADRTLQAETVVMDATRVPLRDFTAWHLDPDRRPMGKRTVRAEFHEPSSAQVDDMLRRNANAGIKLAPAAALDEGWMHGAELEWISEHGECKQLVVWRGMLAEALGRRVATLLRGSSEPTGRVVGELLPEPPSASRIGRYVYEPDAAVLAAGLTPALAVRHSLLPVAPGVAYLTSDARIDDAALATFEVTDVLPYDQKRLRLLLAERAIGRLEIKKRGLPLDPAAVRKQLKPKGPNEAVVLVTPWQQSVVAILARRVT